MPDPHEKNNATEKEILDSEKEAQQEQSENYAAEVPDISNSLAVLATSSGLIINPLNERLKLIRAFRNVNRPDFSYSLLSSDPKKYYQAIKDHALVREEVNKQRKKAKKKGKTIDTVQTGLGPFSRFNAKISLNEFDHKDQEVKLASAVQNRIYASKVRNNIEATAKVYDLSPKKKTELAREFGQWLKANPDKDVKKFLKSRGQKHATDKKDFKEKAKALKSELSTARAKALEANSERLKKAETEIKELSDPNRALLNEEELKARIDKTLHSEKTAVIPEAPTIKTTPTTKVQTIPKPIVSSIPIHRYKTPTRIITPKMPAGFRTFTPSFKYFSSVSNLGVTLVHKGLTKLGGTAVSKVAGKALSSAIAAIPGIGTALAAILSVTGLDAQIVKWITYAAIGVVLVPVGLLLLMIFAPNISRQFGAGLENAESVSVKKSIITNEYSWRNFEEDYLLTEKSNKGEWMQFEDKFLVMSGRGPAL